MAMEYLGETLDLHAGGEDLIFPHHENEIAQSEAKTGKPFSRYWLHVRFLLVEGEKMSKSLGNFYTLRDLILKGHKPSSIRYLLSSVPYRKQLNFTFDGLRQAAAAVERLRNFRDRLKAGKFPPGSNPTISDLARETQGRFVQALEDDLNTAEALGAIFEMLRQANAALDANEVRADDVPLLQRVLERFDEIFDVLADRDAEKMRFAAEWAKAQGKAVSTELAAQLAEQKITDAEIEALIAQRNEAKKNRDFKRADAIRQQFTEKGIILEDTKEGVRWKRK